MDCSMPGFPVLCSLGVCWNSCPLNWRCYPTISSSSVLFSFCLQSFPASGYFPVSQLFASGGQSIGVSPSASVLPMNIQGWFPLGLTGLISLLSKVLLRVFSSTLFQKHQLSVHDLSVHDSWNKHNFDQMNLCHMEILTLVEILFLYKSALDLTGGKIWSSFVTIQ